MKAFLFAAAALGAGPALADPSTHGLRRFSAPRIEANIRKLVSFGTRNSLSIPTDPTRGVGAARRWILEEMKRCGGDRLQVAFDEHLVESGPRVPKPTKFVNVVATLPARRPRARSDLRGERPLRLDAVEPVDPSATRPAPTTTRRAPRSRWSSRA
jgi:hypothetical protein